MGRMVYVFIAGAFNTLVDLICLVLGTTPTKRLIIMGSITGLQGLLIFAFAVAGLRRI